MIDSLTAQKRLVEAGFGLVLVPASSVREELTRRTLSVLDVPELRAEIEVTLIQRKGAFLSPAARRLIDELAGATNRTPRAAATRRPGRPPRA